jgi:hypothetical protein
MKTIEIDFQIHRLIEMERRGFEEPENAALRRLLKLAPTDAAAVKSDILIAAGPVTTSNNHSHGLPWSGKGVELPHGTEIQMTYLGQKILGRIENGTWVTPAGRFTSPSDAAGGSAKTKSGDSPSLNGWIYWEVKKPGQTRWIQLKKFRNRD